MYTRLTEAKLKTGETMEIGRIDPPDAAWRERLVPFLAHKGPEWLPQIEIALTTPLDTLQTRFYVGRIGARMVCHAMTSGNPFTAILGHVYTAPEERRKGAIKVLLTALMDDSCDRFACMSLGSEYGSPAHLLYRTLGFRSVAPESGDMIWSADASWSFPTSLEEEIVARPTRWQDWASWSMLALQPVSPAESLPRSPQLGLWCQGGLEQDFLKLQTRRRQDSRIQAVTLTSEGCVTLAWAILAPAEANGWSLDLHAHPSAGDRYPQLLRALAVPHEPVACLASKSSPDGPKTAALRDIGFAPDDTPQQWTDFAHETHTVYRMVGTP